MDADNQQRRLDIKLGWLGGIIDGEGMITVIKRSSSYSFIPRVSIANSDLAIIKEASRILEELNIMYHLQSKNYYVGEKERIKYEVLINGLKRCSKVLPYIIPYLVSKKDKAERLLSWCKHRLSVKPNSKYTEMDTEILSIRQRSIPPRDYTLDTI
jgi:hypothetical protein